MKYVSIKELQERLIKPWGDKKPISRPALWRKMKKLKIIPTIKKTKPYPTAFVSDEQAGIIVKEFQETHWELFEKQKGE